MVPGDAQQDVGRVHAPAAGHPSIRGADLHDHGLLRGHALEVVDAGPNGADVDEGLDIRGLEDDVAIPVDDVRHLQVEPGGQLAVVTVRQAVDDEAVSHLAAVERVEVAAHR